MQIFTFKKDCYYFIGFEIPERPTELIVIHVWFGFAVAPLTSHFIRIE